MWWYYGAAPFRHLGSGWECICLHGHGGFDGFGRGFFPDAPTCSVVMLDDAGNLLGRLGTYGNRDDQTAAAQKRQPLAPFTNPLYAASSDAALYVADGLNGRVARLALAYAAEETVPVP